MADGLFLTIIPTESVCYQYTCFLQVSLIMLYYIVHTKEMFRFLVCTIFLYRLGAVCHGAVKLREVWVCTHHH